MFCPLSIDWGNVAQWFSGIITLLAVIIALFKEDWIRWRQRPKLKLLDITHVYQEPICIYRLVIKNESEYPARNVEIDIDEVVDNNHIRDNFLPSPHNWTHRDNCFLRDIFPHQTAYLDLLTIGQEHPISKTPLPFISLYAPHIWNLPDMVEIKPGTTRLKFSYYTEKGKVGDFELQVVWYKSNSFEEKDLPSVTIIR